jgi:5-methylcytosine-specific restriction endonuclease McrA
MIVYVLNQKKEPLMPTTPVIARLLLKQGKAKVIRRTPFTIRLFYPTTEFKQEVTAGMDTGSKYIGCAAVSNGKVIYQSEIQTRNNIQKKMTQRRNYRRTRRNRKTRYRKPRWNNRASMRKLNRLAPSVRSKVESHLREKNFVESILPVNNWILETAKFDIHKISDPTVSKKRWWTYQNGNQKGFYNVKAYVLDRDGYKCHQCKKKNMRLEVHHIVYRNEGRTNSPDNLVTLCSECHRKEHTGEIVIKGLRSKTKHATEMGIIRSQLKKRFGSFQETFGYETKYKREQIFKLPKTHYYDAVCICLTEEESIKYNDVVYFKKHVAKGEYQQTKGKRSEKTKPTGKIFGLRKWDKIYCDGIIGFVKGKRSKGYFHICDIHGNKIHPSLNIKKECKRLLAAKTTLIERKVLPSIPLLI